MHHFKLGQNTQNVLYWFFAGASLGFSFLHASLWLLGFVGIILLLRAVYHSQNFKQVLFGSVFMGWLYFGLVLAWYWSVYPINGFVISPTLSILAIFISWFLCALFLGFGKLLVVLPLYFYKDTQYKKYVLWALPLYGF